MTALKTRLPALLASVAALVSLIAECITEDIDRWELIVTTAVALIVSLIVLLGAENGQHHRPPDNHPGRYSQF